MTKKILLLLLTITLIVGAFGAFAIVASAETVMPEMSIAYCNISFRDNVCIKYAVSSNVSDVKILIWTSPEIEYTVGTHDGEITECYTENISGVPHMVFDYTELSAKQMTDVIYARAYAKVDGVDYYSEINKYSILQYAYNKLGKTATASTDTEFKEMLTNMLAYGASAQKYFDYKEDRLASADWYQVKVTEGALADGSMSGLYLPGDKVTLTAPEADAQGHVFSFWVDSNGNEIATTATYELTVGTANEIYTPAYEHTVVIDAAVAPSCNTTGLTEGSHCSVCGEVFVEQEILAATGEHTFGEWETVKDATTTEEGLMERFCACGAKETQTIEKIVPELAYTLNADGQSYSVTGIGTWTDSNVVIPDTYKGLPVTSIGYQAFKNNKTIRTVSVPDGVTSIGLYAFSGCTNLRSINIPEGVSEIKYETFYGCISLTNIVIPDSVTTIYSRAFGRSGLGSINIPDSVTSISSTAFVGCSALSTATIGSGVVDIGNGAFRMCESLSQIDVDECNEYYKSIDGDLYTKDGKKLIQYAIGKQCEAFTVPDGVTTIGENAFYECWYITSIIMPHSVTTIESGAFYDCENLTSMIMSYNIANIGDYAFYGCVNLSTVYSIRSSWGYDVVIESGNDNLKATIYFYSETKPTNTYNKYWHYVDGVPTPWG